MSLYSSLLRPLLFRLEPETAHHLALRQLSILPPGLIRGVFGGVPGGAPKEVFGVRFPNLVGLAAGMDKNAVALPAWEALGFGFVEIGTITAKAQPGNPRPRMFRFPDKQALINRMGFNNDGAEAVAARLERLKKSGRWPRIPVGINLGKSKVTPIDEAPGDYLFSFRLLKSYGDYFVINVSSPNTPGLRDLQETGRLREILRALTPERDGRPLLVKIAPDLPDDQALEIASLAEEEGLSGLIATNTTLDHSAIPKDLDQAGGLSGAPLRQRSTDLLRKLSAHTRLPIVASGGVMDAASAREKLEAGARLVQIYTGFVYRGPRLIREIAELS
jgi:dihydroorotate dehydrogenase